MSVIPVYISGVARSYLSMADRPYNMAPLCICLPGGGTTTRIDRQIDDTSLSLRGQLSRVLGERLHLDGASVVHFIKVTY